MFRKKEVINFNVIPPDFDSGDMELNQTPFSFKLDIDMATNGDDIIYNIELKKAQPECPKPFHAYTCIAIKQGHIKAGDFIGEGKDINPFPFMPIEKDSPIDIDKEIKRIRKKKKEEKNKKKVIKKL